MTQTRVPAPPAADEALLTASATSLAARIRSGELRSGDVVSAHIRHAQRVHPLINAIVVPRFEAALAEARSADDALAALAPAQRASLPPLHGVPCTVKESFALRGMPQTAGLVARQQRGSIATADAPTVARLRAAGAIPLGVTNLSELCMWLESSNHVYGRTRNPYDTRRIVGGSSGGEAAIIASGASPCGLGSDIGGSIRLPAFFNGIFGHKPSRGLVPNEGQFPAPEGTAGALLATGPLCRRAGDLWPLLRILSGETTGARAPADVGLEGLRVAVVRRPGVRAMHAAQEVAVQRAADALTAAGAQVRFVKLPTLRRAFLLWSHKLSSASPTSFHELLGEGAPPPLLRELWRLCTRSSQHTLPALGLALLEKVPGMGADDGGRAAVTLAELSDEIDGHLGPRGVLLQATFPRPAPRHHHPLLAPQEAGYTGIYNALERPATAVPMGLSGEGLPTGIQLVGRHGDDATTIACAEALERATGGWIPPWRAH